MAAAKKATTKNTGFEAFSGINTDSFKDGFEKVNKGFEQVSEFQKDSMEALAGAGNKVAATMEQFSTEQATFAKDSFDESVKAVQTLVQCKSPQEALEVNTEFFRSSFEKNMAQFNKMTEMFVSTSKEATEPLTDSYNQFVEKVQSFRP